MATEAANGQTVLPSSATETGTDEVVEMEVLHDVHDIERAEAEWIEFLEQRAGHHNAFHHPRVIRHDLGEHSGLHMPRILVMRQHGDVIAIAPWYIDSIRFSLKLGVINVTRIRTRLLKLFGGRLVIGRDADPEQIARLALATAQSWSDTFDILGLFDIPVTQPLWKIVHAAGADLDSFRVVPETPEPVIKREIELPETFDAFLASLTSKKRNSLRRHERDLRKQSNDNLVFECVTAPESIPGFLQEVEQVYRRSWQGQTMGGQRGSESQTRFLQTVAAHGWFRSYLVRCSGKPICYGLGYQYHGVYYGEDMAYDMEWRRCAPGNYMFVKLIEDLFRSNTPNRIEFGTGDNLFKQQFSNTTGAAQTLYLIPKGRLRGNVVIRTQRLLDVVYHGIHRTVTRLGIDRWVRDFVKRRKA